MFWEWRNEQGAREMSFHPEHVPWDRHASWFQEKLNDPRVSLLVAVDTRHRPIGQVRYELEDRNATVSLSLDPEFRGRGIGSRLIRQSSILYLATTDVDRIYAHIRNINQPSIRAFEKSGFRLSASNLPSSPSREYVLPRPSEQCIGISQPTYLPWIGYFDQVDSVDTFVLLDSVQFEKQSWHHRNRIKTVTGLQWLSVPVIYKGRFGQTLQDVEIREEFAEKHLRTLQINYSRAPYFENYFPALSDLLRSFSAGMRLVDLNGDLIEWFAQILGIHASIVRASALPCHGKRSNLLVDICTRLNASKYQAAAGSAGYLLTELNSFSEKGINVVFHNYDFPKYSQRFAPFVPYSCVLDLLFNEGPRAIEIIRSGRRPSMAPEEMQKKLKQEPTA